MTTPEDLKPLTLEEVLAWAHKEARRDRLKKSEISHILANSFMSRLVTHGARILETGKGNANYFFMDVDGKCVGISPFASHEEWWEKPSDGFRSVLKRRSCDWGVVLFFLPKREAIWIEGVDFDRDVLKGRAKVNSAEVHQVISRELARTFSEADEFLSLVKTPTRRPEKHFLVSRRREKSHG